MSYFKSGKKCIRYSLMTEYCIWGIFIGITLLVICTVIFKIWKIVYLNPAVVIKNE